MSSFPLMGILMATFVGYGSLLPGSLSKMRWPRPFSQCTTHPGLRCTGLASSFVPNALASAFVPDALTWLLLLLRCSVIILCSRCTDMAFVGETVLRVGLNIWVYYIIGLKFLNMVLRRASIFAFA